MRQTEIVAGLLRGIDPDLAVETVVVTTSGDSDERPFAQIGAKGLFVAEVERAVMEGLADCAVHSAKDLTSETSSGSRLVFPQRGPVHDVVVGGSGSGEESLGALAPGATVGTSSMRRRALLLEARGDLTISELRGNLDTRVDKVRRGECDVAILAAAGLERLGLDASGALDPSWWVPPPGQGALALQLREDAGDLAELFQAIDHAPTRAEAECERAFAAALEGGCSVPLGCLARVGDGEMKVIGYIGDGTGQAALRDRISGPVREAEALGRELAEAMLSSGGDELLALAREETDVSPAPP